MSRKLFKLLAPCLVVLFVSLTVSAQTATATLSGTVEDQNKAAVPGVAVTVENVGTRIKRNITTNNDGQFTVPLLPPGEYAVTFAREGFAQVQVNSVVLNVADQKAMAVQLKIGDVKGEVIVTPEGDLVNTSPAVATTVDRTFVGNLPLNGRSFQSLILLTPGVVMRATSPQSTGDFSVNGQRGNANYFTVDGVSANISVSTRASRDFFTQQLAGSGPGLTATGGTNNLVSIDALEEFKIQTSTYSAEFGRQPGGQIQLATRPGTNKFSGTLFEYFRNEALDANDWFANRAGRDRTQLRQNQFGGTFSGPIFLPAFGEGASPWYNGKDRTFFFFSYEGLRLRLPSTFVASVPSLRVRQQAAPAVQPLLGAFPVPDGPELVNAAGQPLGYAPFTVSYGAPQELDSTSLRIDHTVNNRFALFGRFNYAPSSSLLRFANNPARLNGSKLNTRTFTIGSTLALTTHINNELRFNYSSNRGEAILKQDNFGGAVPVDRSVLVSGYAGTGLFGGAVNFNFPGLIGSRDVADSGEADSHQRQVNIVDNVSVMWGSHHVKFGIDYRRLSPTYGPREYFQLVSFDNETQIRNATPTFLFTSANQELKPLFDNFSGYIQDRWKIASRLTLDLGLRWELNPPPGEASGKKPVLLTGINGTDVSGATLAPAGAPLYNTFYNAFAPRIGLAYQLSGKPGREMVFRGGFGVYYDLGTGQVIGGISGYPFTSSFFAIGPGYPIPAALVGPPPFPSGITLPITSELRAVNPNLTLPYTLQWSLSLDRSLGQNQSITASYVGAAGRDLLSTQNLNNIVEGRRSNQSFGRIIFVTNGPKSDYHAFQLQFNRRLSKGLQAVVSYTWSHAIDEISTELVSSSGSPLVKGNADFDLRHNLSAAVSYNLPELRTVAALKPFFRDWSVDLILHAQSALPIDIFSSSLVLPDGTQMLVRPDRVQGAPLYIEDSTVPGGRRFNSAAFAPPPVGAGNVPLRNGTFGRNVLRQLPLYQLDMALRRQFKITEGMTIQLRGEAFNLFNRPHFANFGTAFNSPTSFGVPTSMLSTVLGAGGLSSVYQIGGARSIQLSARLMF